MHFSNEVFYPKYGIFQTIDNLNLYFKANIKCVAVYVYLSVFHVFTQVDISWDAYISKGSNKCPPYRYMYIQHGCKM